MVKTQLFRDLLFLIRNSASISPKADRSIRNDSDPLVGTVSGDGQS